MINAYKILAVDSKVSGNEVDDAFEKAVGETKAKYAQRPEINSGLCFLF
jgi:hypothetical protein